MGNTTDFFDGLEKNLLNYGYSEEEFMKGAPHRKYERFTLDPCSSHSNHKCDNYFTLEDDGLSRSWQGETVFVNPPYSDISSWVDKCIEESKKGGVWIFLLVPSRTDTKHFEKCFDNAVSVNFVHGRLKFGNSKNSAPFPSVLFEFCQSSMPSRRIHLISKTGNYIYDEEETTE
jgi:site-specific DNA-methyltransferase (adenine-specific)